MPTTDGPGDGQKATYKVVWGKRFEARRLELKMRQATFARRVGVRQSVASRWEAGLHAPRDELRPVIAAVLESTVEELFAYPDQSAA